MIDNGMKNSFHVALDCAISKANKENRDDLVLTEMVAWIHEVLANKRVVDQIRWRRENGLDK